MSLLGLASWAGGVSQDKTGFEGSFSEVDLGPLLQWPFWPESSYLEVKKRVKSRGVKYDPKWVDLFNVSLRIDPLEGSKYDPK